VVTGDVTQIDLPRSIKSGLRDATDVLRDVDGISFTFFTARDVVRHPLVQRIVRAYESREADRNREAGDVNREPDQGRLPGFERRQAEKRG
jgi:phosphate starvation-inducible PhoH-like protein